MSLTRGTKTSTDSKVETFQQSKTVKPCHGGGDPTTRRRVCPEAGRAEDFPGERNSERISSSGDGSNPLVAMDTANRVTMETKPQSFPKRRSIIKHLMTPNECDASSRKPAGKTTVARQRPSNMPVAKVEIPKESSSRSRDLHDVTDDACQRHHDVCASDTGDVGGDAWTEDGAISETVSDVTSTDQFLLEDSISLSETTAATEDLDLDPNRKSSSSRVRDLVQFLPFSHLLKTRGDLEEGDEETVEVYEEFQILEEVEVRRDGGATELIVTLEKMVTLETFEVLYPDHEIDYDLIHRASVSSI